MIILLIEALCIVILAMILSTLIFDERKKRSQDLRLIKLEGYWDGRERRNAERLNVSLAVKYCENGKCVAAKSVDISASGIRLLLDEKIGEGTPLKLEIKLPEEKNNIKTRGEVVWAKEVSEENLPGKRLFNTGIKFSNSQEADEKKLFNFIQGAQQEKH